MLLVETFFVRDLASKKAWPFDFFMRTRERKKIAILACFLGLIAADERIDALAAWVVVLNCPYWQGWGNDQ
ncbi:hypothetical protein DTL42_13795 [Bremerella cremea]|uniref:Uncharacterized protein n=1 Tax=Bremerella cremea TaxID=1031537 RepID=A0A368KQH5_9BACT|nr:hypothetical protein [Bremerella cremea]RCS48270.1 hypothetical protein DTL42_13795 [Bremerella cremea]